METAAEGISDQTWQLGSVMREVGFAAFQVTQAGTPSQQAAAAEILKETRRQLYWILAEDESETPGPVSDATPDASAPDADPQD